MNDIRQHFSFIDTFNPIRFCPRHLAVPMHLRVDEVSDVVPTVRPFKNPKPTDLRIYQISTVHEDASLIFPLFEPFSIHLSMIEMSTNLFLTIINLFHTLTFNRILIPITFVLLLISWLLIFA